MTLSLYSLSISARVTLDMHSLNNEGGEGNQIQTRMVNVVDGNGDLQNVNAISGDMYKHIQAEHLFNVARNNQAMPLCEGCREFNANRINADREFITWAKDKTVNDAEVINRMLHTCGMDDIEGVLITEGRSTPRKSVVEFGWVVGVPEHVQTDSYFHVKYSSDNAKSSESRQEEAKTGSNLGQSIFHRPASSGVYALVCHVDIARIGFNDISQTYAISQADRTVRTRALLESLLYTFIKPNGAMRSSQAPHIVDVQGVLTYSTGPTPAPTVSPLKDGYEQHIAGIVEQLGRISPDTVGISPFASLAELTGLFGELIEQVDPFTLKYE